MIYVLEQIYENNVYPDKPQFYYIKVGCKGVYITRTRCDDEVHFSMSCMSFLKDSTYKIYFHFRRTVLREEHFALHFMISVELFSRYRA